MSDSGKAVFLRYASPAFAIRRRSLWRDKSLRRGKQAAEAARNRWGDFLVLRMCDMWFWDGATGGF